MSTIALFAAALCALLGATPAGWVLFGLGVLFLLLGA